MKVRRSYHPKAESKQNIELFSKENKELKSHHKEIKYEMVNNNGNDDVNTNDDDNNNNMLEFRSLKTTVPYLHPNAAAIVKGLQIKSISMRNTSNGKLIWTSKQLNTDIDTQEELKGK